MKGKENSLISLKQWSRWAAEDFSMLPYVLVSRLDTEGALELPDSWTKAWEQSSPHSFVLESGKEGRYTYLGLQPVSLLHGKGTNAVITDVHSGDIEPVVGSPLQILESWMAPHHAPRLEAAGVPPLIGGCVGFLGYDVVRSLESLPSSAADDPGFPDYLWMRMEEIWIYDAYEKAVYCTVHVPWPNENTSTEDPEEVMELLYQKAQKRAESMQRLWSDFTAQAAGTREQLERKQRYEASGLTEYDHGEWPGMNSHFSKQAFEDAVLTIQNYIRQGDVFQVNLSLRQERELKSSPEQIYEWLRLLNPSPYMGLLRSPGFSLVSASPELLVKLDGDRISARPIAGTRRRGHTPQEDAAMAAELLGSEKERAEHIMLVDLERNDIGKVAAYGSVHVPELMTVENYSHVMHLVSQVEGVIAPGKGPYDVIAALFPGGTITGAPKVRTMEIIEELEPVRRGPYTGSMGWIDYSGNMELNIIIRTMAVTGGMGYIQSGAGIVIDSDPYREYRECHNKAKAMIKAVLCSEEESADITAGVKRG